MLIIAHSSNRQLKRYVHIRCSLVYSLKSCDLQERERIAMAKEQEYREKFAKLEEEKKRYQEKQIVLYCFYFVHNYIYLD